MADSADQIIRNLHRRIHHLEENRRFFQNALEMVLSLADFGNHLDGIGNEGQYLKETAERIEKIIPLQCCSFNMVNDQSAEFTPAYCTPEHLCDRIAQHLEYLIDEGLFAWAIRERKSVFVPTPSGEQALLHTIANHSGVKGIFIGIVGKERTSIPQSTMILITFTLFNLANILESLSLYRAMKNQNELLELKVAERTESLNHSTEELQETMRRLEKMAHMAEQSNQAKSQFLANMSHEIRTPLNGIIGCTELIQKADSLDKSRELATVSLNEAEHLLHLVNNVLDYSKIEAGRIELDHHPFNLFELVHSVVAGLSLQAKAKGLVLDTTFPADINALVVGDGLRLRQILINLVNNAIKFTFHGSVTLAAESTGIRNRPGFQQIRFSVIDTGIGIAEDRQETIFQRFSQADESTTRRFGGTGLGTSIAYQLVSLMGGRLSVQSKINHGSTFSFSIDLALDINASAENVATDEVSGKSSPAPRKRATPARILIAEDTPVNQLVLSSHLEREGHLVVVVNNGREAVAKCMAQPFDVVLMDVQMPEMDGITATRVIMAEIEIAQRPVIMALTADTGSDTKAACLEAGAALVLTKPIRRQALLGAVEHWDLFRQADSNQDIDILQESETFEKSTLPWDRATAIYEFGDIDLVFKVIGELFDNVRTMIAEIRHAWTVDDVDTIRRHAHTIKGGAATVEAAPLSYAAAALETLCKAGDRAAIPQAMDRLIVDFEELLSYVKSPSNSEVLDALP